MGRVQIAVLNESTVLDDSKVRAMVEACQLQIDHDFAPHWGTPADLRFVPRGQLAPGGLWWVAVLDNADQAGALGYHDLTTEGLPLGKVFAGTALTYHYLPSVTLSHELTEMLADPEVNLLVPTKDGRQYWYEVCDAVEADADGYIVSGVTLSNFVLPGYFEEGEAPWDFKGLLSGPMPAMRPGGYLGYYDPADGQHHTVMARTGLRERFQVRPAEGSRRDRRRIPRAEWVRSVVPYSSAIEAP